MKWRYFGRTAGSVRIIQIYRWPDNGKRLLQQAQEDVQYMNRRGEWVSGYMNKRGEWVSGLRDILIAEVWSGWFSENQDELTEQRAMELIDSWRKGEWPSTL